jgi:hypothetical protein
MVSQIANMANSGDELEDECPESSNDEALVGPSDGFDEAITDPLAAMDVIPGDVREPGDDSDEAYADAVPAPTTTDFIPEQVTTQKVHHHDLILDGVCSHCAHCGQPLTDSVSIQYGIGPVCRKKGYLEDLRENVDDVQALIEISEWPALVEFLTQNYKPQGLRGLMNGLVRICSLNRRSRVHTACTNAIEALGFEKLASLLRESICAVELKDLGDGTVEAWVKKQHYRSAWFFDVQRIGGTKQYGKKGIVLRLYDAAPDGSKKPAVVAYRGKRMPARLALWEILNAHFRGLFVKTKGGAVRIQPAVDKRASLR